MINITGCVYYFAFFCAHASRAFACASTHILRRVTSQTVLKMIRSYKSPVFFRLKKDQFLVVLQPFFENMSDPMFNCCIFPLRIQLEVDSYQLRFLCIYFSKNNQTHRFHFICHGFKLL